VHLRSLQTRGKEPFAIANVYIAASLYARAKRAFRSRVALAVLADLAGVKLSRARQTLSVGAADVETAAHFRLPLNAPTVEARCVVEDADGVAVYVGEITYRGDVVHLEIELAGPHRH
jgi:GntR family transcriptional regulator